MNANSLSGSCLGHCSRRNNNTGYCCKRRGGAYGVQGAWLLCLPLEKSPMQFNTTACASEHGHSEIDWNMGKLIVCKTE